MESNKSTILSREISKSKILAEIRIPYVSCSKRVKPPLRHKDETVPPVTYNFEIEPPQSLIEWRNGYEVK